LPDLLTEINIPSARVQNVISKLKRFYVKTRKKVSFGKPKPVYLAVVIITFKKTKNYIPNSINNMSKKHRSLNLFHIIFPPILRLFVSYYFPTNFPIVPMADI